MGFIAVVCLSPPLITLITRLNGFQRGKLEANFHSRLFSNQGTIFIMETVQSWGFNNSKGFKPFGLMVLDQNGTREKVR